MGLSVPQHISSLKKEITMSEASVESAANLVAVYHNTVHMGNNYDAVAQSLLEIVRKPNTSICMIQLLDLLKTHADRVVNMTQELDAALVANLNNTVRAAILQRHNKEYEEMVAELAQARSKMVQAKPTS